MNFGFWCSEPFPGQLRPKITICCSLGRQKRRFGPISPLSYFGLLDFHGFYAQNLINLTNFVGYSAKEAKSRAKERVFAISGPDLPRTAGFSQKHFLTVTGPKFERFDGLRPAKIGPKIRFVCSAPTRCPIEFLVRREEKSPKTDPRRANSAEQLSGSGRAGTHPNLGQHMARK